MYPLCEARTIFLLKLSQSHRLRAFQRCRWSGIDLCVDSFSRYRRARSAPLMFCTYMWKKYFKKIKFLPMHKSMHVFSLLLSALFAKRYTTKCSEWLYSQRQIIIHIRALLQASFAVGFERLMISRISFSETPFVCRRLVKPMYKSSRLVL